MTISPDRLSAVRAVVRHHCDRLGLRAPYRIDCLRMAGLQIILGASAAMAIRKAVEMAKALRDAPSG